MKRIALLVLLLGPLAFAASDCEHTCCRTYNGNWDTDFDDCRHPQTGFDGCVTKCEADARAGWPQPPDTTGGEHYSCKVGFVMLAVLGAAAFAQMKTGDLK